ncbi:hypothetical protein D9M70_533390 [compost metagenome]
MIPEMDEMLKLWAIDMHGGIGAGGAGSGSVLGQLMDCQGELIRGSRGGSRMLLPWSADIEVIGNKHLDPPLEKVVREHYLNRDSLEYQKWESCGCSRAQFYRRLGDAHRAIAGMLLERAA